MKMAGTIDLNNADLTDYTNGIADVTVDQKDTDGITAQKETTYQNTRWTQQVGYFKTNAELKNAIILKAKWAFGGGWSADPRTTVILDHISGSGKQTFADIIKIMNITADVGENAYAHIIKDDKNVLINLKVLNTGSIKRVYNPKGILIRYEQTSRVDGETTKFDPEEILDFSSDVLADEIHGTSIIDALEETIKAENENQVDKKKLMHHQAIPFILWKLKTDDPIKIAKIKAKIALARSLGEDLCVPDDDNTISWEVINTPINPALFTYYDEIITKFYRTVGLPQIIPGATGGVTESSGKVAYLGFEQSVKDLQLNREEQIWDQLQLRVKFNPPASLMENLQTDQAKDGAMSGLAPQPSDLQAGVGR